MQREKATLGERELYMKDTIQNICPGCKRHCTADAPRCKYGRAYFSKCRKAESKAGTPEKDCGGKRRKWEKYVERGGTAWLLLDTGRRAKKALLRRRITEEKLLAPLSIDEREKLRSLLAKLDCGKDET